LDVFIDGFAYFSLFPYIIYDHLKCVSRLRATLYKKYSTFLVSHFHHVLNVVYFLPGNSLASEFYMPMFRNTLSVPSS